MSEKDTIYARMLSSDLSQSEMKTLKTSGEWQEIEDIIKASEDLKLPKYDKAIEYQKLTASNKKKQANRSSIRPLWRIGIAASLLLVIATYFLFQNKTTTVSSGFATTKLHQFEDNSKVTLNDGSSISFDKKEWDKNRNVRLTGEALFQVKKGSPFIVYTDLGTVEVLGTSFNVRSWDEVLYVECFSGKVKVGNLGQEVFLTKGQSVKFVNKKKGITQSFTHKTPFWLTNSSKFDGETLNSVFEELERQYDIEVIAEKFDKIFTGSFTHQSIEQALDQLCIPMGLTFKLDADKKRVTISKE